MRGVSKQILRIIYDDALFPDLHRVLHFDRPLDILCVSGLAKCLREPLGGDAEGPVGILYSLLDRISDRVLNGGEQRPRVFG